MAFEKLHRKQNGSLALLTALFVGSVLSQELVLAQSMKVQTANLSSINVKSPTHQSQSESPIQQLAKLARKIRALPNFEPNLVMSTAGVKGFTENGSTCFESMDSPSKALRKIEINVDPSVNYSANSCYSVYLLLPDDVVITRREAEQVFGKHPIRSSEQDRDDKTLNRISYQYPRDKSGRFLVLNFNGTGTPQLERIEIRRNR